MSIAILSKVFLIKSNFAGCDVVLMPMSRLSSGYDQSDGSEISSIHLHMWQVGLLPVMWLKVLRKRKPCSVVICWRFEREEVRLKHGWQSERRAGVGLLSESMVEIL